MSGVWIDAQAAAEARAKECASSLRPANWQTAGADVVEMETTEVASKSRAKPNVEPRALDRQVRVSRNVEDQRMRCAHCLSMVKG